MKWTKEAPTVEGWYWWCYANGDQLRIVYVRAPYVGVPLCVFDSQHGAAMYQEYPDSRVRTAATAKSKRGLWCGPLVPPESTDE